VRGSRYFPEYKTWLLQVEDSVLKFEKDGPAFIFPKYVNKLKRYNSDSFCLELQPLLGSSKECPTYDSGFFKNGLRASQFRFVTFWQGLAQRFLKEEARGDPKVLAWYKSNQDILMSSKLMALSSSQRTAEVSECSDVRFD
jgi:hypothetical protein